MIKRKIIPLDLILQFLECLHMAEGGYIHYKYFCNLSYKIRKELRGDILLIIWTVVFKR